MQKRFTTIQNNAGLFRIGAQAENITLSDGTTLQDTLGQIDVMHNGSVAKQLTDFKNAGYAPITSPQFKGGVSVGVDQNNSYNISFGVADTANGWQTKVKNELFVEGNAIISNGNQGLTITPPISSSAKNLFVADNGIQFQVGSEPILNINSNNLEILKNIALGSNNLTTTGVITASNIAYAIPPIASQAELYNIIGQYANLNQPFFISLTPKIAYVLLTGKKSTTTQSVGGYGYCYNCYIRQNTSGTTDRIATIFFKRGSGLYESTITLRSANTTTPSILTYNIATQSSDPRFDTVTGAPFNNL